MLPVAMTKTVRLLFLVGALFSATGIARAATLDLKLLIVSTGNETEDLYLDFITDILFEMQVPYDVLDASRETLTQDRLSNGSHGYYNGVLLTQSDLYLSTGSAFTAGEWALLHDYERRFNVRESVLSGWPGFYPDLGVDYGMASIVGGSNYTGKWQLGSYRREMFEYVNTANNLKIDGWAFAGRPEVGGDPQVDPLLVDVNDPSLALVSRLTYADGREVLLSGISHAWFQINSQVLAYEFINFATRGLFIGGRQVHLTAHLDDLFLPNELWNIDLDVTDPSLEYRLNSLDIYQAVADQARLNNEHATLSDFKMDFPFNGSGASVADDLTLSILANKHQFRFINHTYTHADMDKAHPELQSCDYQTIDYSHMKREIYYNRSVWRTLDLPKRSANRPVLVSGNHSGLKDRNCTDLAENAQEDDIHYYAGANQTFLQAAEDTGVKYLSSDSSQVNQDKEQRIPGYSLTMLPRYPTNIYFNTVTPEELTDEFNHVHHYRYINQGLNPCDVAGAVCQPFTYEQIIDYEADVTFRHMMTYRMWSHYFHQSNLGRFQSGNGYSSLMYDWLDAVVDRYEQYMKLPIRNFPLYRIASRTRDRLKLREATVTGVLDTSTNQVTLTADRNLRNVPITGTSRGSMYGGQKLGFIWLSTTPLTVSVDPRI